MKRSLLFKMGIIKILHISQERLSTHMCNISHPELRHDGLGIIVTILHYEVP
jgi:hypothetical protein